MKTYKKDDIVRILKTNKEQGLYELLRLNGPIFSCNINI